MSPEGREDRIGTDPRIPLERWLLCSVSYELVVSGLTGLSLEIVEDCQRRRRSLGPQLHTIAGHERIERGILHDEPQSNWIDGRRQLRLGAPGHHLVEMVALDDIALSLAVAGHDDAIRLQHLHLERAAGGHRAVHMELAGGTVDSLRRDRAGRRTRV